MPAGFMLAGLGVWALHFTGIYAIASLEDLVGGEGWRPGGLVFSVACLVACFAIAARGLAALRGQDEPAARFMSCLAAGGAGLGFIAVAWQTLVVIWF